MTRDEVLDVLRGYFPRMAKTDTLSQQSLVTMLDDCLTRGEPLTRTHVNQFLHFANEAGVSTGFFEYYFLSSPETHPYALDQLFEPAPVLSSDGIASLVQLEWGLRRFLIDGLLYYGNLRTAYRDLRSKSYEDLVEYFSAYRFDADAMRLRGRVLPFQTIAADDRYLIAEIACKAYSAPPSGEGVVLEHALLEAYRQGGGGTRRIGDLFSKESPLAKRDPQAQMMLAFASDEFVDDVVTSEDEIREKIQRILPRFLKARDAALQNTRQYLSIVNELDVYVATSMRRRSDFRAMSRDCDRIFKQDARLTALNLRYFDPTISAAEGHEDKGLIECLMVKCAKALVYFAGDADSFGKDAEVAMALSLGKPVIILCPDSPKGEQRRRFFQEIHPLSRLIHMDTGVAVGAMISKDPSDVAALLDRIFNNKMQYDLVPSDDGYYRLREKLSGSVVRLQTNFDMLRESFWNYYHGIE